LEPKCRERTDEHTEVSRNEMQRGNFLRMCQHTTYTGEHCRQADDGMECSHHLWELHSGDTTPNNGTNPTARKTTNGELSENLRLKAHGEQRSQETDGYAKHA